MIVIRKYLRSFQRETLANRLRLHEQIIFYFVLLSNCSLLTIVTRKFAKFQKQPPRVFFFVTVVMDEMNEVEGSFLEAATGGALLQKQFLKILQYSKENICVVFSIVLN